ncbi:hypothetical protein Noda2021_01000 [Candidatus Dependentiae bacterium Noda2021]|nr:hypothetical protein Noda2021_01000 [Candidatus Dependentiae bacterium Noda2021]
MKIVLLLGLVFSAQLQASFEEIMKRLNTLEAVVSKAGPLFIEQKNIVKKAKTLFNEYLLCHPHEQTAHLEQVNKTLTPIGRYFLINAVTNKSWKINIAYERVVSELENEITVQKNKEFDDITSLDDTSEDSTSSNYEFARLN